MCIVCSCPGKPTECRSLSNSERATANHARSACARPGTHRGEPGEDTLTSDKNQSLHGGGEELVVKMESVEELLAFKLSWDG